MRNAAIKMVSMLLLAFVLAGCSMLSDDGLFDIDISVQDIAESTDKVQLSLAINESAVSGESWVLFEVRNSGNKGTEWLKTTYTGNGVFSTETDQLRGKYKLIGHFYASGGIHFSRVYKPESGPSAQDEKI